AARELAGGFARRVEPALVEGAQFRPWRASEEGEEARAWQPYVNLPCSRANTEGKETAARSCSKTLNSLPQGGPQKAVVIPERKWQYAEGCPRVHKAANGNANVDI